MKTGIVLLLMMILGVSCSNKSASENGEEQAAGIEVVDGEFDENEDALIEDEILGGDDEFLVDGEMGAGSGDLLDEAAAPIEEGDAFADTSTDSAFGDGMVEDTTQGLETGFESAPAIAAPISNNGSNVSGSMEKTYTVKANETLMLIAFKLYGDYLRWKELANLNSGLLNGGTSVTAGMQIRYPSNGSDFVWNPEGEPYLIKRGDTLGRISTKVYGQMSKWRKIWDNNRPLIKDPNKIYAGFTLYYLLDNSAVATR